MNDILFWLRRNRFAYFLIGVKYRIIDRYRQSLSDEQYIKEMFKKTFGREIDLDEPKTFNEKLQWLKLYWYDEKAEICADKLAVRQYLTDLGYGHLLNDLLGVWNRAEDIDFDSLPDKFVLKCTHGSGCNLICTDKSKFNIKKAVKQLNKWLETDYYILGREWVYKNIKPKIVCEKFIESENSVPVDYKVMCFNGKADNVMLCLDRETGDTKFYFFDRAWNFCRYDKQTKNAPEDFTLKKPDEMDEIFSLADKLSEPFPFVRMDFYCEYGRIYFGEFTFFPAGGFDLGYTEEVDLLLGSKLKLPEKKTEERKD